MNAEISPAVRRGSGKLILVDLKGREKQAAFTANDPIIIRNGKRYAFGVATHRGSFYYEIQ